MATTPQVGDIGTKIALDCVEAITTEDVSKILYTKPDGVTTDEWVATQEGTTVYYITEAGDLDQAGCWILQSYVELSGGWEGSGDRVVMTVYPNV